MMMMTITTIRSSSPRIIMFLISLLLVSWLTSSTFGQSVDSDGYDCSLTTGTDIVLDPLLTLRMKYQPVSQYVAIQVTYAGLGYVAFQFNNATTMIPAISVIGVPATSTVGKYSMIGKTVTDVNIVFNPLDYINLYNTSVIQNSTHTILSYARSLTGIPADASTSYIQEVDIQLQQDNIMMWAYGSTQDLEMHISRGTATFTPPFEECTLVGVAAPTTAVTTSAPAVAAAPTPATTTSAPVVAAAPTAATTSTPVAAAPTTTPVCSYESTPFYPVNGKADVLLRQIVDPVQQVVSIELTYAGMGWVSLGFSTTGKMSPANSVIGLPVEQTVQVYDMEGYIADMVTPQDSSALTNTSIVQNDTHSVLTYTRPLITANEVDVVVDPMSSDNLMSAPNMFIWAVGNDNTLANGHIQRGNDTIPLNLCSSSTNPAPVASAPTASAPTASAPAAAPSPDVMPTTPSTTVCSYESTPFYPVNGNANVFLRQILDPVQQVVSIELTYAGMGWVSLGFSTTGKMSPANSVIGLPVEQTIQVYDMEGYIADMVTPLASSALTNTSIVQNDTHTVLTYTRPLVTANEVDVVVDPMSSDNLMSAPNMFIWAVGNDNTLANGHIERGNDTIPLNLCSSSGNAAPTAAAPVASAPSPAVAPTTPSTTVCSYEITPFYQVNANTNVLLRQILDPVQEVVSIEVTYVGVGWVSLGLSTTGKMSPANSVIGLPVEQTVQVYDMEGYIADMVTPLGSSALTNTSIVQNETHTVLTYTRPFAMANEVDVVVDPMSSDNLASAPNMFIWAVGNDNTLANGHVLRGNDTIPFTICGPNAAPTASAPSAPIAPTAPVAAPAAVVPTATNSSSGAGGIGPLELAKGLTCSIVANRANMTITVEMVYEGLEWIGWAVSPDGKMASSVAVIGAQELGASPQKYDMSGYSATQVVKSSQQTLTDAIFTQNTTHTYMKFTKLMTEPNEQSIMATGNNLFLWAIGTDQAIQAHSSRDEFNWVLCDPSVEQCGQAVATAPTAAAPSAAAPASAPSAGSGGSDAAAGAGGTGGEIVPGFDVSIIANKADGTVTVEVTYLGDAWISWAVSPDGKMAGSVAVIGAKELGSAPKKYDMSGRSLSQVVQSPQQTLTDGVFTVNDTHTYMKFTKLMVEDGEQAIVTTGSNIFIWAIGTSDKIQLHAQRNEFSLVVCDPSIEECGSVIVKSSAPPHKSLWLCHGVCMALAWVLFVPVAIFCSVMRSMLPPGPLWFTIHKRVNSLGILFTFIGFFLAVIGVAEEGKKQFTENPHYKTGLVIFLFALFQAVWAFFKPPAPAPPPPPPAAADDDNNNAPPESALLPNKDGDNDDDDDDADDIEKMILSNKVPEKKVKITTPASATSPPAAPPAMPKKSTLRLSWEICHRVLGFALVGISWYNCDTGFRLYSLRFAANSLTPNHTLWGCIGALMGIFVFLYTYSKAK